MMFVNGKCHTKLCCFKLIIKNGTNEKKANMQQLDVLKITYEFQIYTITKRTCTDTKIITTSWGVLMALQVKKKIYF